MSSVNTSEQTARGKTYVTAMTVGSAAKTTLARHVLLPHTRGARIISVESATPDEQATDLYQRGESQVREMLRFELFARSAQDKIIDCGVTDSEMAAELLTEVATLGRAQHITVVLPVLVDPKGLRGLEHFAGLLPSSVRKVAVLTRVRDGATAQKFLIGKVGAAVTRYCCEQGIALCPIPFLHSDLLDSDAAVHAVALRGRTLEAVAALDLDALASQTAPDREHAAQFGLLIGAAAMAPAAIENARAIYRWIVEQE